MARPTIMTPEVLEKLEQAFLLGATDVEACLVADIAPATLYKYQERNPEFSERKASLKEMPVYQAREAVIKAFKRDPKLAMQYLERKRKDEFSTRTEQDVTSGGEKIETNTIIFKDFKNDSTSK
jgi:hypothetical protein